MKINTDYCNFLRDFDSKVPYNYNKKELRPFIGVLFFVGNIKYFAPLSSPKPKHLKLKNKIDLLKIDSGRLGVVNFNNMLPVCDNNIISINVNIDTNNSNEAKYLKLLEKQLFWLNRNKSKIYNRSKGLYDKYINNTLNNRIKSRCCNFPLLEEKCKEYNS